MKNFLSKLVLITVLMMSVSSNVSYAQNDKKDIKATVNQQVGIAKCVAKGNLDFLTFMRGVISSEGMIEGLYEPWRDVFSRNSCQSNDIAGLINQRDKMRKYIRDAFLTCNTQKLPDLKKTFNKLNAEIYYVRHVVNGTIVISLPYSSLSIRLLQNPETLFLSPSKLYADMKLKYVDSGMIIESDFKLLFNLLNTKYSARRKSYVVCENSAWKGVADKWTEFINNAGGITPAWNNAVKGVKGSAQKFVQGATDVGFVDYVKGIVNLNINNQTPAEGFGDILATVKKSAPLTDYFGSGTTDAGATPIGNLTQESIVNASNEAARRFDVDTMRILMSSNFESLYKDAADTGVKILVDEVAALDKAIVDSLPILGKLESCSDRLNSRQCASSK